MLRKITHTSMMVHDQDAAVAFYTEKLGFKKAADSPMGPNARWVTVALPDDSVELIFEKPDWYMGDDVGMVAFREQMIGKESLVLGVDDCQATYETLLARGVTFAEGPTEVQYGIQALAHDLYGNMLVLVQPPEQS